MSLRYAVLDIIQNNPRHGYEIKQAIEEAFGSLWNVSYGQLYPTLRNLTEKGLVKKHIEQGQKSLEKNVYQITEKGSDMLEAWLQEVPKKTNITGKDEFALLYLSLLLRNNHAAGKEALNRQKQYFLERRIHFQDRYDKLKPAAYAQRALLRRILLRLEAEISWLDELKTNTF